MRLAPVSRNDRDRLDGQEQPSRKRDARRGPRRRVRWEILSVEAIRNFTILQISHEGRSLHDVLQITAGGLQDGLEMPDGLPELGLEPTRNRPGRVWVGGYAEVNTRLPGDEQQVPDAHGLRIVSHRLRHRRPVNDFMFHWVHPHCLSCANRQRLATPACVKLEGFWRPWR